MPPDLTTAEAALGSGEYGKSLELLEALAKKYHLPSKEGAEVRMLMVTAWMGQGQEEKAMKTCRLITHCKDAELRQLAKQMLSVLEAPSLERPKNWSVQLPILKASVISSKSIQSKKRQSIKSSKAKQLPPTGPTEALQIGFISLVIVVLIGLTMLLSGCVSITTRINLSGPDRLQLAWDVESSANQLLPWQIDLADSLGKNGQLVNIKNTSEGTQKITSPTLNSEEANLLLKSIFSSGADAGGLSINEPSLTLDEQNWVIGVRQDLKLFVDLMRLPELPGLKMSVIITPRSRLQKFIGDPNFVIKNDSEVLWVLEPGKINTLELHDWRWSVLGIGAICICILLMITLLLQTIRVRLGFGFPELPP